MPAFSLRSLVLLAGLSASTFAQTPASWLRPVAPHKLIGSVYYVGTEDLACYLITGDAGHILINTPLEESTGLLLASVKQLGFRVEDIKILLVNQAHQDHAAGLKEIQELSGAAIYATPPDAKLLAAGGVMSAESAKRLGSFAPVTASRLLRDGDTIKLGEIALKVYHHYGHTPGSSSYEMTVTVDGKRQTLLFANLPTIVMPLTSEEYPAIVTDLQTTFRRQTQLSPDIWFAGHASQFNHAAKMKTGDYADAAGFRQAVDDLERKFERQMKIELGK